MISHCHQRLLAATCLLVGVLPALLSGATITTSTSSTAPTTDIVQSFVPGGGVGGFSWRADSTLTSADAWRDTGQSFTATQDFALDSITLKTQSGANPPALNTAFTLTVYSFASIFNNSPSATLATYSGTIPAAGTLPGGTYVTFDLSQSVQLTKDAVYGFVLHYESMADSRSIAFVATTNTSEFATGRNLSSGSDGGIAPSSSTFTRTNNSLQFYLGTTSSIPEPGAAALIAGAAMLGCAIFKRRRD